MIEVQQDRLLVQGAMTIRQAREMLEAGRRLLGQHSVSLIDLGEVTEVDSSGLAVVFAWLRFRPQLRLDRVPHSLQQLAGLYGAGELLNT